MTPWLTASAGASTGVENVDSQTNSKTVTVGVSTTQTSDQTEQVTSGSVETDTTTIKREVKRTVPGCAQLSVQFIATDYTGSVQLSSDDGTAQRRSDCGAASRLRLYRSGDVARRKPDGHSHRDVIGSEPNARRHVPVAASAACSIQCTVPGRRYRTPPPRRQRRGCADRRRRDGQHGPHHCRGCKRCCTHFRNSCCRSLLQDQEAQSIQNVVEGQRFVGIA